MHLLRYAALTAAAAAFAAAAPTTASAAVTCDVVGSTMNVDVTSGSTVVRLERGTGAGSNNIIVFDGSTAASPQVACGGPTVNTVDTIDIDEAAAQGTSFHLSMLNGPFTSGVTDESGSSDEIEFTVDADTAGTDQLVLFPAAGNDNFRFGSLGAGVTGVNLNGAEADGVDSDMSVTSIDRIFVDLGTGDDVASGAGTGVPGSTPTATTTTFIGGPGNDTLTAGSANNNDLEGGPDNDTLIGGVNSDYFGLADGNDVADGNGGADAASYLNENAPVTLDLRITGPQDTGGHGTDTLTDIEDVYGSDAADTIIGNSGPNLLTGGQFANDQGADTLIGHEGNDILWGAKGNDTMVGGPDNDSMVGGEGIDTISYATGSTGPITASVAESVTGSVQVTGGAGSDTLAADPGVAATGHRIENIIGSQFGDTLTGGTAPNKLVGLGGNDTLNLADNDDTFDSYDGGADTVNCGIGTDSGTADEQGVDQLNECEAPDYAPKTSIAGGPADGAVTKDATPTYDLTSDEAATFQRSVDGGPFEACPAACELPTLADGDHTVAFRAVDSDEAGNIGLNPVTRTVRVDTSAPPATPDPEPGTTSTPGGTTTGGTTQNTGTGVATKASTAARRSAKVSRRRKATIGSITCGSAACAIVPGSAKLRLGAKSYRVSLAAPKTVAPGAKRTLTVSLSRAVYAKLGKARKGTLTVKLSSVAGGTTAPLALKLRLTR